MFRNANKELNEMTEEDTDSSYTSSSSRYLIIGRKVIEKAAMINSMHMNAVKNMSNEENIRHSTLDNNNSNHSIVLPIVNKEQIVSLSTANENSFSISLMNEMEDNVFNYNGILNLEPVFEDDAIGKYSNERGIDERNNFSKNNEIKVEEEDTSEDEEDDDSDSNETHDFDFEYVYKRDKEEDGLENSSVDNDDDAKLEEIDYEELVSDTPV